MEAIYYCTCGNRMLYDTESTLYLKCSGCNTVVIDVDVVEKNPDQLTVVDYGIEYIDDEEWMHVECKDSKDNKYTYWKKRCEDNCVDIV